MATESLQPAPGDPLPFGLLPASDRLTKPVWTWHWRTWEFRGYLGAVLTAAFLVACGGLLAVIALRGYTIYG